MFHLTSKSSRDLHLEQLGLVHAHATQYLGIGGTVGSTLQFPCSRDAKQGGSNGAGCQPPQPLVRLWNSVCILGRPGACHSLLRQFAQPF